MRVQTCDKPNPAITGFQSTTAAAERPRDDLLLSPICTADNECLARVLCTRGQSAHRHDCTSKHGLSIKSPSHNFTISTMAFLLKIRNANITTSSALPYRPVAVFVGGTTGVGAGMAKAFAEHRKGDAHIVIIGRNRQAAQDLIATFPKPAEGEPLHEFVECDVSLMRNVRRTTAELVGRLPKLNFLVLSPGILTMKGRNETDEGIDRKLALHYYARWRFTYDLVPLLQKAVDANEDAKVMTVLSGFEGADTSINLNDLGLKNYSVGGAAKYAGVCNNAMIESFAELHPAMAFTHISPGIVRSQILNGTDDWRVRLLSPFAHILGYVAGVTPDVCAEYMWHGMYAGKAGWYRRNSHGEALNATAVSPEVKSRLWQHTLEETGRDMQLALRMIIEDI
ncbi:hypothetical protein BC835DRAFT_1528238 [Cytidiella melzeri]|nr:hypothetical protein BC835DRAFT_1528238 [Cytidiella melzeri]